MTNAERTETILRQPVGQNAYLHTVGAGVYVPLVQSGISGGLIGLLVLVTGIKARWEDAWFWGLMAMILTWVAAWFLLQRHWFSLTALEKSTGMDFNGDGVLGSPDPSQTDPPARTVQVNLRETTEDGHLRVTVARFPIDEGRLAQLAQGLLSGTPFGERYWAGSGKLLSQDEFRGVRAEMLRRRLLEQVNPRSPKQGFRLTRGGRAAMRELATTREAPSPTPPEETD